MKLGYGTYGMPDLAVLDAVDAVADAGYDGVELCCLPGAPAEPERLDAGARAAVRQRLEDRSLALCALMLGLDSLAADPAAPLAALRAACDLAHDLAPAGPPVLVTTPGGRPSQWDAERERVAAAVAGWAAVCAEAGLTLALEPHVGGVVHRPEQAEWVRQQVDSPALAFNYDESHFVLRDIPTAESAAIMAPHAVATHLKDAAGSADDVRFLLPGDGDFDYPGFFRLLSSLGYDGWLTVEVSGMVWKSPGYDAVASARRCREVLDAALDQAGLSRCRQGVA